MWTALGKGIRDCLIGAIILAAAAIVVGGMTDTVPAAALESIAEFFQYAFLLVFASVTWAAHALADVRLILFGTLVLLLVSYVLTRPQ
jgi:hypothetical protein